MKNPTLALIVALSSSSAIASHIPSDSGFWGGDLDGHFDLLISKTADSAVRLGGPVDMNEAYSGLDGDYEVYEVDTSVASPSFQLSAEDLMGADLDGNIDI